MGPKKGTKYSLEVRQKMRLGHLGTKRPLEVRKKMSEAKRGEKNNNWKGGITPENMRIRQSFEYKLWRKSIFERDKFTCIWCKQIGGKLTADHIKPFALFPELRFAIDNGRTLCIDCHRKTDSWGGKIRKNYPKFFG